MIFIKWIILLWFTLNFTDIIGVLIVDFINLLVNNIIIEYFQCDFENNEKHSTLIRCCFTVYIQMIIVGK